MTTNQQRAAERHVQTAREILVACNVQPQFVPTVVAAIAAALDEAEARGRAEVAQQLRDRHTRDGYGLCRECTTYGDDARDILQPVTWPCATRHSLAAGAS